MVRAIKFGLKQLKKLRKVKNLHVIMDLAMMKITNNFPVNVNLKTVVAILCVQNQDGELIEDLE